MEHLFVTPVDVLKKARELITDPEHWCKKAWALNKQGGAATTDQYDLTGHFAPYKFCMLGAIAQAHTLLTGKAMHTTREVRFGAQRLVRKELIDWGGISNFNDNEKTTHQDVLAILDQVIEAENK